MITALLVDDEPMANDRMAELLASFPEVEVIGTACDAADAERYLSQRMPDVVFLDLDMPGRSGLDVGMSMSPASRIVFVTAHADRALDAFRVGAIDYVLKPVDRDRLAVTIDRVRQRIAPAGAAPGEVPEGDGAKPEASGAGQEPAAGGSPLELASDDAGMVLVTLAGSTGIERLRFADIAWIESHRNYTAVHALGRPPLLVRSTLSQWESILPPGQFGRVSRSLLVHVAVIQSLRWRSRDQTLVVFRGVDAPLPLGRAASTRLKGLLG